jgi:adenosylcobinamide kinase/adenosylcobinamide-phosphate guanylyltransferase
VEREMITLVLGGQRSGKSRFALEEARKYKGKKAFIATSERIDEEMVERIERHKKERGEEFETFEEPRLLPQLISKLDGIFEVILIDCLTIWVSNLLYYGVEEEKAFNDLLGTISGGRSDFLIVSNEVGLGIIPETKIGRRFIDALGTLNRMVAQASRRVVFMVSGIPLVIKGG